MANDKIIKWGWTCMHAIGSSQYPCVCMNQISYLNIIISGRERHSQIETIFGVNSSQLLSMLMLP